MSAAVININSVGRTSVTVHGHTYKLSPVERRLLTKLGGAPWTIDRATPEVIAEANATWTAASRAAGYATALVGSPMMSPAPSSARRVCRQLVSRSTPLGRPALHGRRRH